jgi:hypothetical protein
MTNRTNWNSSSERPAGAGRIEAKYIIPESLAAQVLQWSSVFLQSDRGLASPQRVTSLYLDTPDLGFFRWHVEGRSDRFKLRVRGYGDRVDGPLYAEIKRKTNGITRKLRAEIPRAALSAVLGAAEGAMERELEERGPEALRAFIRKRRAFHAKPRMLVTCMRHSLRESTAAGEVAVTVDRQVQYQPTASPDLSASGADWRPMRLREYPGPGAAIIELKYVNRPPQWMRTLTTSLAPYRINFSKYKAAMQQHAEWSSGYGEFSYSGIEHADVGAGVVVRAVPCDRARLYAY